jgi:hypothetical protein
MPADRGRRGDPCPASPRGAEAVGGGHRERGPWALLVLVLLSCLVVAAVFLRGDEGTAETARVAAVDRPASAGAPDPPADPARARAVEKLDGRLEDISRSHPASTARSCSILSRPERLAQRR